MSSIALVITFKRREKNEKHNLRIRFFFCADLEEVPGASAFISKSYQSNIF